jgi:hypothetical protein
MCPVLRVGRRAAAATLAAAGIGLACRSSVEPVTRPTLDDIGDRYVRLALALGQHQPSLIDAWLGPAASRPARRRPVAEIRGDIESVREAAVGVGASNDVRGEYLRQQLDALLVAARRLSGESLPFVDEARASLGSDVSGLIESLARDRATLMASTDPARSTLARVLPGRGSLHERHMTFRMRHALPASQVDAALRAALDVCRRRVRERLELPDTEAVHITPESSAVLEARALYEGRFRTRILVDTSRPIDVVHLVWLVAHETYPGHHVQHVLAERDLQLAKGWGERALQPSFGRHLLCSEGAAEASAGLLFAGAAFEGAVREVAVRLHIPFGDIARLVTIHRAVRDLDMFVADVARAYLDGEIGTEAAAEQLQVEALAPEPRVLLSAIERLRARVLAYPIGRRLVAGYVEGVPATERWGRLAQVSTTMVMS